MPAKPDPRTPRDNPIVPTTMTVILPDGTRRERIVQLKRDPSYDELAAVIDPELARGDGIKRWLERVAILTEAGKLGDMFVDETGAIDRLPRNEEATTHYRRNWLKRFPECHPEELDAIYGPAILFDRRVWY